MKIIAATDLHIKGENNLDYLKAFNDFVSEKNPDLRIVLGDILDYGFKSEEHEKMHRKLLGRMGSALDWEIQEEYWHLKEKAEVEQLTSDQLSNLDRLEEALNCDYLRICYYPYFAGKVSNGKCWNHSIYVRFSEVAKYYLESLKINRDHMNESYAKIKEILDEVDIETLTLMGNHDLRGDMSELKDTDMHKKVKEVKGFKIAGYGSAATEELDAGSGKGQPLAVGCPPGLTPLYKTYIEEKMTEKDLERRVVSEPKDFLDKEQPDIALLHNPIYGYLDRSKLLNGMHVGDKQLLEYARQGLTKLFLTGHIHEDPGVENIRTDNYQSSIVINPSSLGKTEASEGNFVEIELDDETKELVTLRTYKIELQQTITNICTRIVPLVSYVMDNFGKLVPLTLVQESNIIMR